MRTSTFAGLIVGAVGAVVVLQVGYAVWIFHFRAGMDTRGQFGDVFGAVNAFFTGLAFAGVLLTLFLQRRELEGTTTLSIIAALMNTYTSQIDAVEVGNFRFQLFDVNAKLRDKIESWAGEEVAETSGNKEAMKDEIRKSVDSYIKKYPHTTESAWFSIPQNRRTFEAWVYARRQRNHLHAILEDKFESSGSGQRVTREYKRPTAPDTWGNG
jgi:hypothetical protein